MGTQLLYGIDDVPPPLETLVLGLQHYLTMFGSTVAIPLIMSGHLGLDQGQPELSWLISTMFFVSGITTLLQTTLGNRLPIVQGGTFSFLGPAAAICKGYPSASWRPKLRTVQGAVIGGSVLEIVLGYGGLIGRLLRLVTPVTVAPTIALIGLALYQIGAPFAGTHWGTGGLTIVLIIVFSQYLNRLHRAFELFPILLAIVISWGVCALLTATGVFATDHPAYVSTHAISSAPWFRLPYPFQWGSPVFTIAGIIGMLAGYIASMVESIGDYYAAARLSGAGLPTAHMINRGIGMEGVGCLVAGAFGTGNGTTSYSENIGAIGLTRVGSRRVVQAGALLMLLLGLIAKFGAVFTTIPQPVVGGMYCAMFGMIASVGLSNLQFIDLNSGRNLFTIGFAFFMGLSVPHYFTMKDASGTLINHLQFDPQWIADVINTLGSSGMAVGAVLALILDNTIPGTDAERGISAWSSSDAHSRNGSDRV